MQTVHRGNKYLAIFYRRNWMNHICTIQLRFDQTIHSTLCRWKGSISLFFLLICQPSLGHIFYFQLFRTPHRWPIFEVQLSAKQNSSQNLTYVTVFWTESRKCVKLQPSSASKIERHCKKNLQQAFFGTAHKSAYWGLFCAKIIAICALYVYTKYGIDYLISWSLWPVPFVYRLVWLWLWLNY